MRIVRIRVFAAAVGMSGVGALAVPIYGGPAYDSTTGTGYNDPQLPAMNAGDGIAAGHMAKYDGGISYGTRGFRWDTTGKAATELATLDVAYFGYTSGRVIAMNGAGTAVGDSYKHSGTTLVGYRAVRWDAGSTVAVELGNLGLGKSDQIANYTSGSAFAINRTGTAVGYSEKFDASLTSLGYRAVRWDAGGTAATELGTLGTDRVGETSGYATAINAGGTAIGYAEKYSDDLFRGYRAVRWDAGGTAATELDGLGTGTAPVGIPASGFSYSRAYAINDAGTTAGVATKCVGGVSVGTRASRWDAGATTATELGNLGTDASGVTTSTANAINAAGTIIGVATKYAAGANLGQRAVRWDADSTAAFELGNLGTDGHGVTTSSAFAVNDVGIIVGSATKYVGGSSLGDRAVFWNTDGVAVELNTLLSDIDATQWTLISARTISTTNWVTGIGRYDPDASGPLSAYDRAYLMQVPEPTGMFLLGLTGMMVFVRKGRQSSSEFVGCGSSRRLMAGGKIWYSNSWERAEAVETRKTWRTKSWHPAWWPSSNTLWRAALWAYPACGKHKRALQTMASRNYDEERELMAYVFRNYPGIVRRQECLPSEERLRDELPAELRAEYAAHAAECQRIRKETREKEKRLSTDGSSIDINPIMPEMSPELVRAWDEAFQKLEKQAFWDKFLPRKDQVFIHRCARCQRVLINEKTRQCLWCGAKWH